jgi:gliding motility-associated-like protein
VDVSDYPVADFRMDLSDDFYPADVTSFSLDNISTGGVEYLWSFGDGNTSTEFEPAYQYSEPGSYQVMLVTTNPNGCRDSMLTSIEIRVPESIYVPNAFSPNGDSQNDVFSITARNITELRISIFDKWGEIVYSSHEKDFVWDGTYFGHRASEGAYVYKIAAKGFYGKEFNRTGTISVVR